jgi:hypothetical protein
MEALASVVVLLAEVGEMDEVLALALGALQAVEAAEAQPTRQLEARPREGAPQPLAEALTKLTAAEADRARLVAELADLKLRLASMQREHYSQPPPPPPPPPPSSPPDATRALLNSFATKFRQKGPGKA